MASHPSAYIPYYEATLSAYATGLKLVVGGTGLGKTSGIVSVVQSDQFAGRKGIYCANRLPLLEEMPREFRDHPEQVVFLRRDLDVVLLTLEQLAGPFHELLGHPMFGDYLHQAHNNRYIRRVDVATLRSVSRFLQEMQRTPQWKKTPLLAAAVEKEARFILRAFRAVLLAARHQGGKRQHGLTYEALLDHPVIQSLFPFIAFQRRPEARLLLVTLQKAYYGFFDGERSLNLMSLHHGGAHYVLFLDEFDYLENDLISMICHAPQIDKPFQFVEFFYNEMARHKLLNQQYPVSAQGQTSPLRPRIIEIQKIIERIQQQGLRFPGINQFTSSVAHHAKIFRTRHTMSTDPLYIEQTDRAFHLLDQPTSTSVPAYHLFQGVSAATSRILTLFKEMEVDDEKVYREIREQCYEVTVFADQMDAIAQYPRPAPNVATQQGSLLATGYSLFDIHAKNQMTDPDEVEVQYFAVHETPEAILRTLAIHHLVFGLSATADIPRCLHHFDLDWLAEDAPHLADAPLILPITAADRQLVAELNERKAKARTNQIHFHTMEVLDTTDPLQKELANLIHTVATDEDRFGRDPSGHLQIRAGRFFRAILDTVCHAGADATHLMFLTSFRQIRLLLDAYGRECPHLFTATLDTGNTWFDAYRLIIKGQAMNVVFFNTAFARITQQSPEALTAFHDLFWQGVPVVVLTQYQSAGNGVNLQFPRTPQHLKDEVLTDYSHLYLIEAPYYYFNKPDHELAADERIAQLKENLWYLAKLHTSKYLSHDQFLELLKYLHQPDKWNQHYHHDPRTRGDKMLNNVATYIQAIGRIERTWQPLPDQHIFCGPDVLEDLQIYVLQHADERAEREALSSATLRAVLAAVDVTIRTEERAIRRRKDLQLGQQDRTCRERVGQLVRDLRQVRYGEKDAAKIRGTWEHLRLAVLRHDFEDPILAQYACLFTSPLYQDGVLRYTGNFELVPPTAHHPLLRTLRPDSLYETIRKNPTIHHHFEAKGYELRMRSHGTCFTPYSWQAILSGAIGEEATVALLREQHFPLESMPDALFELVDFKLAGVPWYLDSKNYHDHTLDRFPLAADDPLAHPKLNEAAFQKQAQAKLAALSRHHQQPAKLIYFNLLCDERSERLNRYFSADFDEVATLAEAEIIVIQGALQRQAPSLLTDECFAFFADMKKLLPSHEPIPSHD